MALRTLGPYELERQLGVGGFGAVWVGRHRESGARHALKVLELGSPEEALRFQREAEALARLDHNPGAVRVHAAFHAGSTAAIAMELIEGRDLRSHLAERGPLEPRRAAELVVEVARAVAHAHRRGVLHRDLKPANVLLDGAGRARLVDLGLAAVSGGRSLTRTGEIMGTPGYVAPEQVLGERCDERTDVFGLGALLFACLTGRPPREGPAPVALLARAAREPVRGVETVRPDAPAALRELVRRATALAPADRFQSADELIAALEGFAGRPGARIPAWWIGAGAVLLAGVAALVAARAAPRGEERPPPVEAAPSEAPPPPAPAASSAAGEPSFDLRRFRGLLAQALERDRLALTRDREAPVRQTVALLREVRGSLDERPEALSQVARALREQLDELVREGDAGAWTVDAQLAVAVETYRFYLFDPTPHDLSDRVPLVLPMDGEMGWTYELVRTRLGLSALRPDSLRGVDPELRARCPRSRLLSLGELHRWHAAPSSLDAHTLANVASLALGLDPDALDELAPPAPGSEVFQISEFVLCWRAWVLLAEGLAALRAGAGDDARAVADALHPLVARSQQRCRSLLGEGLELIPVQSLANFLRECGSARGSGEPVREAIALRHALLTALPERMKEQETLSVAPALWRMEERWCPIKLAHDLTVLHRLEPGDRAVLLKLLETTERCEPLARLPRDPDATRVWRALRIGALLAKVRTDLLPSAMADLEEASKLLDEAAAEKELLAETERSSRGLFGPVHAEAAWLMGRPDEARERLSQAIVRARAQPQWGTLPLLLELERAWRLP